jgi:hypothetical protein
MYWQKDLQIMSIYRQGQELDQVNWEGNRANIGFKAQRL